MFFKTLQYSLYGIRDQSMNDDDKKAFLEDYRKADLEKKLDMWYFALDQEIWWDEILTEMADTAQALNLKRDKVVAK
jgi:hypothetical protein